MFKFVKNLGKKNKIVSTEFMTDEEYIAAIEPRILEVWTDRELSEQYGIVGVFTETAKRTKILNSEEAFLCFCKLYDMSMQWMTVANKFSDGAMSLKIDMQDISNKHMKNILAGKELTKLQVKHEFFSAQTIYNLFVETSFDDRWRMSDEDKKKFDRDKSLEYIDNQLLFLADAKKLFFQRILLTANSHFAVMTGFKDN